MFVCLFINLLFGNFVIGLFFIIFVMVRSLVFRIKSVNFRGLEIMRGGL